MADQLEVAREALAQIGTRSKIESLDDGSAEATYINLLYDPLRNFLLAQGDYDFSLHNVPAIAATGAAVPWLFAYACPDDCIRVRQMVPSDYDSLDPRPVTWNTTAVMDGISGRIIQTKVGMSRVIYTRQVNENLWDSLFHQSFVRFLSSALAFALENRMEASKVKMEEALQFAGLGNLRDT